MLKRQTANGKRQTANGKLEKKLIACFVLQVERSQPAVPRIEYFFYV